MKLETSSKLQDRFERWTGGIFGGNKAKAEKEAMAELQTQEDSRKQLASNGAKEVYEYQKYKSMSKTWKAKGEI